MARSSSTRRGMSVRQHFDWRRLWAILMVVGSAACLSSHTFADGWHNTSLNQPGKKWVSTTEKNVKEAVQKIDLIKQEIAKAQMNRARLRSGVDIGALEQRKDQLIAQNDQKKTTPNQADPKTVNSSKTNLTAAKQKLQEQEAIVQSEANTCLEVLAFMQARNIIRNEFPKFDNVDIPLCRKAAKDLLGRMGPTGSRVIVGRIRNEMMQPEQQQPAGITEHDAYRRELLEVLRANVREGNLGVDDLRALEEAASGQKQGSNKHLADNVKTLTKDLDQIYEAKDLTEMAQAASRIADADARELLKRRIRRKTEKASVSDLLDVQAITTDPTIRKAFDTELTTPNRLAEASLKELSTLTQSLSDEKLKRLVENRLANQLTDASMLELINQLSRRKSNSRLTRQVEALLRARRPTYTDVKDQVGELWKLTQSPDRRVATEARRQVENAFQRAPISHCLYWIGRGDKELEQVVWDQVDGRIARADSYRKTHYRDVGLEVVRHPDFNLPSKREAFRLLRKLKDVKAADHLIEQLPQLPRELWPVAGETLRELTGQDFGPHKGDGPPEVLQSTKKWREWLQAKGAR